MRNSRVKQKLAAGQPVLCTKINVPDPVIVDMIGLLGFDCLWICREHGAIDLDRLGHLVRTANMNDMDTLVRVPKGSYSDFIHPLELGATGIMVPHVAGGEEARSIARATRYHPQGRRPLDGGNSDGHYCMIPLAEYLRKANENTFVVVQIEDPETLERIDEIAAVDGIDCLFVGPGDLSHGLGAPGTPEHPTILKAVERVAAACARHGRAWGLPVSAATAPRYLEMGARFLSSGADVLGLHPYFLEIRKSFERLGFTFQPKL